MVNLDGVHNQIKEYDEGEPCINCECEYDNFYSHSDGNQHYYYCEECDTTWYNETVFQTWRVD